VRINHRARYLLTVAVIICLDQVTKFLIRYFVNPGEIIRVFNNDMIWLVYVLNPGMAFGIRVIPPFVLMIITFTAAVGLGIFIYRNPSLTPWQGIPFSLIMGGAVGNFIDRIIRGEVIDFLSVNMPDFIMLRFPAFNVADSAISVGITSLIVISFFRGEPRRTEEFPENKSWSVDTGYEDR